MDYALECVVSRRDVAALGLLRATRELVIATNPPGQFERLAGVDRQATLAGALIVDAITALARGEGERLAPGGVAHGLGFAAGRIVRAYGVDPSAFSLAISNGYRESIARLALAPAAGRAH